MMTYVTSMPVCPRLSESIGEIPEIAFGRQQGQEGIAFTRCFSDLLRRRLFNSGFGEYTVD